MRFIVLVFLLLALSNTRGTSQLSLDQHQEHVRRTLTYQELLDEMIHCQDSIYLLRNAVIQFDPTKDQRFKAVDSAALAAFDTIAIQAQIQLEDITFEGDQFIAFSKISFEKNISIEENGSSDLILVYNAVQFQSGLTLKRKKESSEYKLALFYSDIQGDVNIEVATSVGISDCKFGNQNKPEPIDSDTWAISIDQEDATLRIEDCYFYQQHQKDALLLNVNKIYSLKIFGSYFEVDLDLSECTISDLTLHTNSFKALVDLTNIEFGSAKSEIRMVPMSKRICVYSNDSLWIPTNIQVFEDTTASERFFAVYRKLIDFYKTRGNRKEYNLAYTEMKDYETLYLQYDYVQNPNLENWFIWKMNQFLATFSNYGTTPVKAILYAIRVILLFTLFFFFFHNDWNTFTQSKLMARMRLLSRYFRSEEGIAQLYEDQTKPQYESYEEFLQYIQDGKKELPRIFLWIAKPLYTLSTSGMKVTNTLLRRAEFLDGKWVDLNKKKKGRTAFWTGLFLLGSLLIALLLRIVNALMLSINSFTTLGFGDIPTKGLARYGAIIEGFIGWFLLTIFSVSLISQLLQ